jgi:hypothetical protein
VSWASPSVLSPLGLQTFWAHVRCRPGRGRDNPATFPGTEFDLASISVCQIGSSLGENTTRFPVIVATSRAIASRKKMTSIAPKINRNWHHASMLSFWGSLDKSLAFATGQQTLRPVDTGGRGETPHHCSIIRWQQYTSARNFDRRQSWATVHASLQKMGLRAGIDSPQGFQQI